MGGSIMREVMTIAKLKSAGAAEKSDLEIYASKRIHEK